jgi:hypothetical protein
MFAYRLACLIAASGGFDHYRRGRDLAILGLPLAANSEERCWWLEWGTVSGLMVGAPFAAPAALSYSRVATGIARILPVVRAEATAHADARFGPPPLT